MSDKNPTNEELRGLRLSYDRPSKMMVDLEPDFNKQPGLKTTQNYKLNVP